MHFYRIRVCSECRTYNMQVFDIIYISTITTITISLSRVPLYNSGSKTVLLGLRTMV